MSNLNIKLNILTIISNYCRFKHINIDMVILFYIICLNITIISLKNKDHHTLSLMSSLLYNISLFICLLA